MGTEKRERQKANRLQRQIEEERAAKVSTARRTATRFGLIALVAVIGVVILAWIGGAFDGDDEDEPTVAEPDVTTTIAATDIPKPDVALPDELPDELVVTDLVEGTGPEAAAGDSVSVYYVGVLSADGTEFDTNYGGTPFTVPLGQGRVIQGWDEGLVGVQEGGRYQLDIPADMAYGDTGSGAIIQPGDAITFVVDVLSVTQN